MKSSNEFPLTELNDDKILSRSKLSSEDLALLKGLKEMGYETAEDLDNSFRAILMLRIMAVKAKGYMTEEEKEMIEFGIKAIQIQ